MFDRYTLEKSGDGYSITLYLNRGQEEFASEPGRKDGKNRQRLEGSVREYVKEKFPDMKMKTAKVMLGTVLVASVPLGGVAAATGTDTGTTTETTTPATGETTGTTTTPTGDTTTTPADETTTPPADETTTPPADETTTPPADETTTPPADETTTPPADETTTPPADETTTPPADETTTPPADETTTPPADETTTPPAAPVALKDIEKSYAHDQIEALVAAGVLTGYEDGTFRPTANMSRQEFAVVLAKSLDLDVDPNATTTFTYVAPWAAPYVAALHEAGMVAGFSDTVYGANAPVTREQLATFYVRALGFEEDAEALNLTPDFKDAGSISDWAAPSVAFAKRIGLIEGIPNADGTVSFAPNANAQRQQVAVVADKFYSDPEKYRTAGEALVPAETTTPTTPTTPAPDTTTPDTTAPETTTPETTTPDTTTPDTTAPDTTAPDTTAPDTTTPETTSPETTSPDATPATTPDTDTGTAAPAPDTTTPAPAPDVTATPTTTPATSPDTAPDDVDIT